MRARHAAPEIRKDDDKELLIITCSSNVQPQGAYSATGGDHCRSIYSSCDAAIP